MAPVAPAAATSAVAPEMAATIAAPVAPAAPVTGAAPAADPANVPSHSTVRPSHQPRRDSGAPLGAGTVIGNRYVIKELAGQGGFAAVYRAADNQIPNHEVALKLINAPSESPAARESALRELTLIAAVSHPSVVQFKDYGWHEGRLYFAMPWYRGRTLASSTSLDRADARRVFERCAYGLSAMHEAGICHYDIKPDNIFLANIAGFEAGFPVLLDLGIAAKRGEKPTALTPEYASPETAMAILDGGATPVGTAADVFSLALSLRNVLEPETIPLFGESLPAALHQRATVPVDPPSNKEFEYLKPLFARWLSIDPTERPTAAEFASELQALTAPEERRADRKRMLMRVLPIVGVFMVVAAVLAFQLTRKTEELVQHEYADAKEDAEANQRFAQLKQNSANQLDEKLQLAQQFQMQRDQTRVTLDATTKDRDSARADLRARTRERDNTRSELQKQTRELTQTQTDLASRSTELSARTAELAQARREVDARNTELARTRTELETRENELARSNKALAAAQAEVAARTADFETYKKKALQLRDELNGATSDLEKRTRERDKAQEGLEKRTKERDKAEAGLEKRTKERDKARAELQATATQLSIVTAQRDQALKASERAAKKKK